MFSSITGHKLFSAIHLGTLERLNRTISKINLVTLRYIVSTSSTRLESRQQNSHFYGSINSMGLLTPNKLALRGR